MGNDDEENADSETQDGDAEARCPYCDSIEDCDHLVLMVDRTFREALGGLLWQDFGSRWADICNETEDPDFNESQAFDELLDEVDSLCDSEVRSSPNSAPGLTSSYSSYFCSSKKKASAAVKAFCST
jgi:hypothetical protein